MAFSAGLVGRSVQKSVYLCSYRPKEPLQSLIAGQIIRLLIFSHDRDQTNFFLFSQKKIGSFFEDYTINVSRRENSPIITPQCLLLEPYKLKSLLLRTFAQQQVSRAAIPARASALSGGKRGLPRRQTSSPPPRV